MEELPVELKELLERIDREKNPITPFKIESEIRSVTKELYAKDEELENPVLAESIAFMFCEDYSDQKTGWGTYYGPMAVFKGENGQFYENPNISRVTPDIIKYWEKRAEKSEHPVLKARYSDLVWDFSKKITGKRPNISNAHTMIDASIELVKMKLYENIVQVLDILPRALSIALSIGDSKRLEEVKNTILNFEDDILREDYPQHCGFAFDNLINIRSIALSEEQETKIITDLLGKFEQLCSENKFTPNLEDYAIRLAKYFRKKGETKETKRILKLFGDLTLGMSKTAEPLVGYAWMKKVYDLFIEFNMKQEADSINKSLRELGEKTRENMHPISAKIEISNDEIDNFLKTMTDGGLEATLKRIAVYFLPNKDETIKTLRDIAQKAVFISLLTKTIVDDDGRPIAEIGPLEEDIEGNVIQQISKDISFSKIFLHDVIEKMIELYNTSVEDIINYLFISPVFSKEKKPVIEAGLKAFLKKDYIVAIHLLIPQIENALRNLCQLIGGPIYKPHRYGGFLLKNFTELIREEKIKVLLGDDIVLYLRVLYTDQRGWNVRNIVCHGMAPLSAFDQSIADRILHTLLLLAMIQKQEN